MTNRLARLFWEAADRVDYTVALARCWVVDRIYGPEPATVADKQREAAQEKLGEAFPMIGLKGTIAAEGEARTRSLTRDPIS